MSRRYLVPASGAPLPHPTGELPAEGGYVDEIDHFWRRRLADQDVADGTPPEAPEPAPERAALKAAESSETTAEPAARTRK